MVDNPTPRVVRLTGVLAEGLLQSGQRVVQRLDSNGNVESRDAEGFAPIDSWAADSVGDSIRIVINNGLYGSSWTLANETTAEKTGVMKGYATAVGDVVPSPNYPVRKVAARRISCPSPDTPNSMADVDTMSARRFVQDFYDWYIMATERHSHTVWDSVTGSRSPLFSQSLLKALRADIAAQRATSEIVSVVGAYDPFTNSQDPCARYEAGRTTPGSNGVEVAVWARCGDEPPTLAVLVDVSNANGTWRFEDFRVPGQPAAGLRASLQRAAEERIVARMK